MIEIEDLIHAYMVARGNKKRSPDQVEFELHWHSKLLRLYHQVLSRSVRPTAYTFICKTPKPREVFASDMSTRILHHYLDIRLRPLLEKKMSRHTFNNRVGMGQTACQSAVISDIYEMSAGFTRDAWIIKLDLSGCFPNIIQDVAYKQLEEVILNDYHGRDKDELIYMLNVCIFSYPTHHCYRKSRFDEWKMIPPEKSLFNKPDGIGSAIGHLIWQNAVNYYFHEIDEWFMSIPEIRFERYVDDMFIITHSKDALLLIPELRRRLAALGARLNEKKFYCQHYTKGVECLGAHIKLDRIYPNRRTVLRAMAKVQSFKYCVRKSRIDALLASLNSYTGIFKNINGFSIAYDMADALDKRWAEFVHFDRRRVCFVANEGYRHRQRICEKYGLLDPKKRRRL